MDTEVKTRIAKTTLGRKLAEYTSKLKLGEDAEFIGKLKASDAKQFGYPTLEEYQKELNLLEANRSKPGKRDFDAQFQMQFSILTGNLWKAIANSHDKAIKTASKTLVEYADSYKLTAGIGNTKRTDYRRMIIATVGQGKIGNYFGGWGDGSNNLRNQFTNGRLNADATSNLDGDAITNLMQKVLRTTSPYNNGQPVPQGKSSGYEIPNTDQITIDTGKTEIPTKNKRKVKKVIPAVDQQIPPESETPDSLPQDINQ